LLAERLQVYKLKFILDNVEFSDKSIGGCEFNLLIGWETSRLSSHWLQEFHHISESFLKGY